MTKARIPPWTWIIPLLGWLLLGARAGGLAHPLLAAARGVVLVGCVRAAVHHAEVVARRVGEPFGTLLLALAVTSMEVALIVSLSLKGEATLARDTVFATIMLILNGMVGLCLLLGASRHREQHFSVYGVSATLAAIAAISVITLVLPNTTTTAPGPYYSTGQLAFVGIVSLVLYGVFVLVQTVRHRDYFLPQAELRDAEPEQAGKAAKGRHVATSGLLALAALGGVILLAKSLGPALERGVAAIGAPEALVGVIVAAIVLLPESLAAIHAARADRLQTSLNLALGSAMASIGLTIPAVAAVSIATHWQLALGIGPKETVLLALSLLTAALSLGTGRTTVLQGAVHLVILGVFLFTAVVP